MTHNIPMYPAEMANLRSLSCSIGRNSTLVQGSGGNTSIKDGHTLWVKASGTWLSDAEDQEIMVPVDLQAVKRMIQAGNDNFINARLYGNLHPSIETSLHCQLNHKVVAHVHSVNAIASTVQKGAKNRLMDQLRGINWRYIPYAKPGASLTSEVIRVITEEPGNPSVLVLENHGLVVGGETCQAVESLLATVETKLQITTRTMSITTSTAHLKNAVKDLDGWRLPNSQEIHKLALDPQSTHIARKGALIPDHAVFLEKKVPVCASLCSIEKVINEYQSTYGTGPDWMIVRDNGVILSNRIGASAEAQLLGLTMISLRIPSNSDIKFIDEHAAKDLQSWDAEKYRTKLDENSPELLSDKLT